MIGYKIIIIFNKETSQWEPAMCELEIPDDAKVAYPVIYEPFPIRDYVHSPKKRTDRAIVKQILEIICDPLQSQDRYMQTPHMLAFDGVGYSAYEIANGLTSMDATLLNETLEQHLAGRVFFSPTATIYRTGETVCAPLDVNIHEVCASGIHFFMHVHEALDWLLNFDGFVMAVIDHLNRYCVGDPDLCKGRLF